MTTMEMWFPVYSFSILKIPNFFIKFFGQSTTFTSSKKRKRKRNKGNVKIKYEKKDVSVRNLMAARQLGHCTFSSQVHRI